MLCRAEQRESPRAEKRPFFFPAISDVEKDHEGELREQVAHNSSSSNTKKYKPSKSDSSSEGDHKKKKRKRAAGGMSSPIATPSTTTPAGSPIVTTQVRTVGDNETHTTYTIKLKKRKREHRVGFFACRHHHDVFSVLEGRVPQE